MPSARIRRGSLGSAATPGYRARYEARRRRWLAAVHPVRMAPHVVAAAAVSVVAAPATAACWASVLAGRGIPPAIGRAVARSHRYFARLNGTLYLLTEQSPVVRPGGSDEHPVRLEVPPRHPVDRRAALRCAAAAPAIVCIDLALGVVVLIGSTTAWVMILATGRMPLRLHRAIAFGTSYHARSAAYLALLCAEAPPLRDHVAPVVEPSFSITTLEGAPA